MSAPEGLCQGQVPYPARGEAKRAAWAEVDAAGRADLTPVSYRCPRDPGHFHYEIQDPGQIAARLAAKGVDPSPEDLLPASYRRHVGESRALWATCPSCGSGWGRPHFPRCTMDVPAYPRPITGAEARAITMFAISIFPLDRVRRSTIRAMLPRGDDMEKKSGGGNRVSRWFQETLVWAARYGYIERDDEHITVLRRKPMVAYAGRRMDAIPGLTEQVWLAIAAVALPAEATAEGRAERERELDALRRLRELDALRRLMQDAPGATGPHGGRGYTRVVPPAKPL